MRLSQLAILVVVERITAKEASPDCAQPHGNCFGSRCCSAPSHECFLRKGAKYAQCRPAPQGCIETAEWLCLPHNHSAKKLGSSETLHAAASADSLALALSAAPRLSKGSAADSRSGKGSAADSDGGRRGAAIAHSGGGGGGGGGSAGGDGSGGSSGGGRDHRNKTSEDKPKPSQTPSQIPSSRIAAHQPGGQSTLVSTHASQAIEPGVVDDAMPGGLSGASKTKKGVK